MKALALAVGTIAIGAATIGAIANLPREVALASYATPLNGRTASQAHNARLAADRLDGAIVQPGGSFSFNQQVGSFSRDRGFRRAPVSYNGQLIDDWGGGVCQVSTTLYNAALLAGMTIVERNRHHFCPSYVPPGRDAAVAFSNIDLRFVNRNPAAVRIHAFVDGQLLRVEILGTHRPANSSRVVEEVRDVREPTTFRLGDRPGRERLRNSGKRGYDVAVYRITGERRELISQDCYPVMNRVLQYQ